MNNNTTPDLISINGLDEMQRGQAYKIAFNCFKAFYWGNIIIGALLVLIAPFFENILLSLIGIGITLFASIIYIIFAVKSSEKNSLNPDFLNKASSPRQIINMTCIGLGFAIVMISRYSDGAHITALLYGVFMVIFYLSHIITYLLARKAKKLMSEETEEE